VSKLFPCQYFMLCIISISRTPSAGSEISAGLLVIIVCQNLIHVINIVPVVRRKWVEETDQETLRDNYISSVVGWDDDSDIGVGRLGKTT
jgi:hypothetical protein